MRQVQTNEGQNFDRQDRRHGTRPSRASGCIGTEGFGHGAQACQEQWRQQSDLTDARKDEQWKNLLEKFGLMDRKIDTVDTSLNKKMDELGGNIRWLGKIVIGAALSAMVAGVVAFMMKGGFNVP